jgi:CheY-like chemotaxis protein
MNQRMNQRMNQEATPTTNAASTTTSAASTAQTALHCCVATDDERLISKVRSLEQKHTVTIRLYTSPEALFGALELSKTSSSQVPITVAFVDLHAHSFDGYALCASIKSRFPAIQTIGSSLGVEPAIVQRAKLSSVDALLQRYRFEELLRSVALSANTPA